MTAHSEMAVQASDLDRNGSRPAASEPGQNPLQVPLGVYVTIHGHFYQPPRENPYLEAIERQPSASPFHDWNERIHSECYRPNAFARVLNDRGEIVRIVNNFEYLSFNIGPTLMSWLERYDVETYQQILEGDRKSAERLEGHGNAIAQVYNHIILPLANERDKYTQIRWGVADFRHRFGRDPEGIWLAETAIDRATLEVLADEGIRFTILAPSQVERCRPLPTESDPDPEWHEVGGGQIDPTRPYRVFLPSRGTGDRRYVDVFFYDGPISRDMGFNRVLDSSSHLVGRIGAAVRGDRRPAQLVSMATDGETFGHHKQGKEKCIAYAFVEEFAHQEWTVTNYAHYLSIFPPTWEAELKPVTAWSCSHGVDRWQDDCGCGGGGSWHQKWRRPLRDSLNWLRDRLIETYESAAPQFFHDPWAARDDYISPILDRSPENVDRFFNRHQTHVLTPSEQVDALRLLEMQRHSLLMFTSCGWFFDELSRPEGVQVLRYAARALELAGEVTGVQLEPEFVRRLSAAPSNVAHFQNGERIYHELVAPARIGFEEVGAHYAIASLFSPYGEKHRIYCYGAQALDYQLQRMGNLTLAVGQLHLVSEITQESAHLVFAVLHLGGWDFYCCLKPFATRLGYARLKDQLFDSLARGSAARVIVKISEHFDGVSYSLADLCAEERHRIMNLLSRETIAGLDQLYSQAYRDNYGVLTAFHRDELPVPRELQVAAEVALGHRASATVDAIARDMERGNACQAHLAELVAIAREAEQLRARLEVPKMKQTLEQLVWRSLWDLLREPPQENNGENGGENFAERADTIETLIDAGEKLHLNLNLQRPQELLFGRLCARDEFSVERNSQAFRKLLRLGQKLAIDTNPWLDPPTAANAG